MRKDSEFKQGVYSRTSPKIKLEGESGDKGMNSMLKKRTHRVVGRRPNGRTGHAQPKVFRCPLESCGKIFHDRASLKKHNTVHGDKLF